MVLNAHHIHRIFYFLAVVLMVASGLAGCNDEVTYESVDCSTCITYRPDSGDLIIRLTIDAENPQVPVAIYRDRLENNDIRFEDTVSLNELEVSVPLGHYYTVTAEYVSGQDTILAIDGDIIETKKVIGQCETTCWIISGGVLNVQYRKPY
ncbi:MAG: hypothetical protein GXO83_06755 [Chlorobi bacterium]|nr:hypothetical protein [Chlorobiota bacterium]